jgi:hypothetical protein
MSELTVHPVADLFPMRSEPDLRMMAEDIKDHGLIQPLIIDKQGQLLDGRNRLAACKIAQVEPRFETYEGDDPDGFILAINGQRRDLTRSQRAIIAAQSMESILSEHGAQERVRRAIGVSKQLMSQAVAVVRYAPERASEIMHGGTFDGAYAAAQKIKERQEADETARASLPADLAALVESGHRTLEDAQAETGYREIVAGIDKIVIADDEQSFADRVAEGSITWREAADLASLWEIERQQAHERCRDSIRVLVEALSVTEGIMTQIEREPDSAYVRDMLDGLSDKDRDAFTAAINRLGARA